MSTQLNTLRYYSLRLPLTEKEYKDFEKMLAKTGSKKGPYIRLLIQRELAQHEMNHISEDLTPQEDLTKHGVTEILDSR